MDGTRSPLSQIIGETALVFKSSRPSKITVCIRPSHARRPFLPSTAESGASPAPHRDAVASLPFRLLLGQTVSVGGSFEGILWLCQLYPNVRNLFVFNKALMIRGGEFGQGAFRPVPLFSPWVPAPPAGETAREREKPSGTPGKKGTPAGRPTRQEQTRQKQKKGVPGAEARREPPYHYVVCGGVLLSHTLSSAVPSPRPGLSFRVRKGTGRLTWAMTTAKPF